MMIFQSKLLVYQRLTCKTNVVFSRHGALDVPVVLTGDLIPGGRWTSVDVQGDHKQNGRKKLLGVSENGGFGLQIASLEYFKETSYDKPHGFRGSMDWLMQQLEGNNDS